MAEPVSTGTKDAITRAQLVAAMRAWGSSMEPSDDEIRNTITSLSLEMAIMPGVRPARTFEAAFREVFRCGLDGKAVRARKASAK